MTIHILKAPSGRYCFVGSLPAALGDEVPASTAAVMGQRAYENDAGELVEIKFPTFLTAREAQQHIRNRGLACCNSATCACHTLK